MSFDEIFLCRVVECLKEAKIDHVVIGATAAILHGVPIMTQDVDIFVRDTDLTRKKIKKFAGLMGGLVLAAPAEPMSKMIRAIGAEIPVDFVFNLSSRRSFESVRSRATSVVVGRTAIRIASLEDIIESKQAAAREKDRAVLGMLKDTLRVQLALGRNAKNNRK
ncbi:MAG: nucleotidyltransferase [Planctomycetota bacterium]|nr:nucleotidyltransferase [Planctomycetota bacterium]